MAVVTGGTSGTLTKGTVPLPGGETAIYNSTGLEFIRHTNYLGSSVLATTWAHAVYSKEAYAPFGETYNEAGTADRSFTGQDQDTVAGSGGSGIYDYLFRKYDPSAGRWLSPDPAGWASTNIADPQSFDRYAYVENQPMSFVDSSGLACAYYSSGGMISVDNSGAASGAPGVCAANGGSYWDGYLDPTDAYGLLAGSVLPGAEDWQLTYSSMIFPEQEGGDAVLPINQILTSDINDFNFQMGFPSLGGAYGLIYYNPGGVTISAAEPPSKPIPPSAYECLTVPSEAMAQYQDDLAAYNQAMMQRSPSDDGLGGGGGTEGAFLATKSNGLKPLPELEGPMANQGGAAGMNALGLIAEYGVTSSGCAMSR